MGTSVMSAESEESMIEPKAVQQCKDIVRATTWEGDIRVNITTIIGAGRILAKRVDELEKVLDEEHSSMTPIKTLKTCPDLNCNGTWYVHVHPPWCAIWRDKPCSCDITAKTMTAKARLNYTFVRCSECGTTR
jgi:hypothetical protein